MNGASAKRADLVPANGTLGLSCGIESGSAVLAAQSCSADFAYIGSAFIATHEARASEAYKQAIVDSNSCLLYTSRCV